MVVEIDNLNKLVILLFYITIGSLASNCIEPYNSQFPEGPKRLVIEGEITTKPGPYTVRLSQTEEFTSFFSDSAHFPIENALVTISDDNGNEEKLFEFRPGVYKTALDGSGLRGKVGNSYTLTVVTQENRIYQSTPELIEEAPDIESISHKLETVSTTPILPLTLFPPPRINFDPESEIFWDNREINPAEWGFNIPEEFRRFDSFLIADSTEIINHRVELIPRGEITQRNYPIPSNNVIKIEATANDIVGKENYYKWVTNVIFKAKSYPEHYALRRFEPVFPDSLRSITIRVEKDCCSECWVSFKYPSVQISNDSYKDGGIIRTGLSFIPINNFFFQERAFIEVELSSISFHAYSFYRGIRKQIDNVGSLFDLAPELLVSNITNTNNPDEIVLGYFNASDSKSMGFYINATEIDLNFGISGVIQFRLPENGFIYSDDCRTLTNDFLYSVAQKPEWWID
ncbi:MAG: DUF4249 domain-containing protein [Cyclobacteriaceae bacterium]